jgi:hypothetical protein
MRHHCPAFCIAACLSLAIPRQGFAVEPTISAADSAEFKRGYDALAAKDWAGAEQILGRLWMKTKTYDIALSLGQAELMLSRYRDAAEHLAFGIHFAPPRDYPAAELAKKGLEKAKSQVGTLKLTAPPGSEIYLDGKPLGTAPLDREIYLDAGRHKVKAVHPKIGWGESSIEVSLGTTMPFEVRLTERNEEASSPAGASKRLPYQSKDLKPARVAIVPPPPVERTGMSDGKLAFLVVGGTVTLGAAVSTLVFALKGSSVNSDAKELRTQATDQYGANPCSNADAAGICASIDRKLNQRADSNRVANWSLGVGAVAATATLVGWVLWPNQTRRVASTVQIVPVAGQSVGGLLLDGKF